MSSFSFSLSKDSLDKFLEKSGAFILDFELKLEIWHYPDIISLIHCKLEKMINGSILFVYLMLKSIQ